MKQRLTELWENIQIAFALSVAGTLGIFYVIGEFIWKAITGRRGDKFTGICLAMLMQCICTAQASPIWQHGSHYRPRIAPIALSFAAGQANGIHEAVHYHWPAFQSRFPNANPQFWNPAISWENKYAGGRYVNGGERFPGSTTVFAWTTDAKHLFGSGHRAFLFGAGVTLTLGEKRHWSHYVADGLLSFAAYSAGFHLWYSGIIQK